MLKPMQWNLLTGMQNVYLIDNLKVLENIWFGREYVVPGKQ